MSAKLRPILLALLVCTALLIAEEQRIGGLRKTIAQLSSDAVGARERLDQNAAELAKLRERNDALVAESEQLRERIADARAGTPATDPATGSPEAGPAKAGEKSEKGNWMTGLAKMLSDPEMKKLMRTQQSAGTRMMYGDLAKELGLSADQTDKVMELLTARQAAASELALGSVAGSKADPAKSAEVAGYDAKLQALLGPEKAAKLNEYERTTGDRMAIRQYERSFSTAGLPLDDTQSAGLLQIMKEERMKVPASPLEAGGKDPLASIAALQKGEALEQSLQTQRELQQRVLARAHTVLTPDQMTAFDAAQKQQLQRQETGVKWGRAIFGGGQ